MKCGGDTELFQIQKILIIVTELNIFKNVKAIFFFFFIRLTINKNETLTIRSNMKSLVLKPLYCLSICCFYVLQTVMEANKENANTSHILADSRNLFHSTPILSKTLPHSLVRNTPGTPIGNVSMKTMNTPRTLQKKTLNENEVSILDFFLINFEVYFFITKLIWLNIL